MPSPPAVPTPYLLTLVGAARGTRAPGALTLLGAGSSAELVLNMSYYTVILFRMWKIYKIDW